MKKLISHTIVLLAAIVFVACGKGDDKGDNKGGGDKGDKGKSGAVVGSCDQREVKGMGFLTCNEYTGKNWTAKEVEAQCVGDKKFIAGSCPADGIVLSCKMYAGEASELTTHYYDKPEAAKAACEGLEGVVQ